MKSRLFVLLSAVLLTVCATNVYAQAKDGDNSAKQGQVTLNINLSQIQTLVVNPKDGAVNLNYGTKYEYEKGASATMDNHLTVFSTGGFKVTANTTSDLKNGDNVIESSDIMLVATAGDASATTGKIEGLTIVAQDLISSDTGGRDLKYNVTYSAKGNDAYINNYVNGENPTVYTTAVTYTITTP